LSLEIFGQDNMKKLFGGSLFENEPFSGLTQLSGEGQRSDFQRVHLSAFLGNDAVVHFGSILFRLNFTILSFWVT